MKKTAVLVLLALMAVFAASAMASAAEIAVVDTEKILTDSIPGKMAATHMQEVRKILDKGFNDLKALYRGKENTPEGSQELAAGGMRLDQQYAAEEQAVLNELQRLIMDATAEWRKKNPTYTIVISKTLLLDADPKADKTKEIMSAVNKLTPNFPDLPTVTFNK